MFRHVLRIFAACALAAPAMFASLAASPAAAQDDEAAGHSRGGYAWGEEREEQVERPAEHRYGRVFASLGAGGSVRIIQYETLIQDRFAPPYLQLRGGYFFEGEGMVQHGVVLGVATPLAGDGTDLHGVSPFGQYVLAPAYMIRLIPEGDLGHWFQATGRIGIPVSIGGDQQPDPANPGQTHWVGQTSWGWEAGLGMLFKPLEGLALYGEIDFSMYFATEYHPLLSFEIGVAIDYEVLP